MESNNENTAPNENGIFSNHMLSKKYRRSMNRIFREQIGSKKYIPHPEADNSYERFRSSIIRAILVLGKLFKKHE